MKLKLVFGVIPCIAALAVGPLTAAPTPLSPSGTITDRSPILKWTDTGAPQFTVELTRDDVVETHYAVSAPKLELIKLAVGVYRWRVKEGPLASILPWSGYLAFTIPPIKPSPNSPVNSCYVSAPTKPTFTWTQVDPGANRYQIRLYRDNSLLDTLTMTPKSKYTGPSVTWPDALPAGTYEWSIRAMRKNADPDLTLTSPWSARAMFSIGVPMPPKVTWPSPNSSFASGLHIMNFNWTAAAGANSYLVRILCNGSLFHAASGIVATPYGPNLNWGPGHYTIMVQGVNGTGKGQFSEPVSFQITREMSPANEAVLAAAPSLLLWTRSNIATYYRLRLYKHNSASGLYEKIHESSINQSAISPIKFKTSSLGLGDGAYKWQITDFYGDQALYTSTAYFSVLVSGRPAAIAPTEKKFAGLMGLDFIWGSAPGSPATHYQFQLFKEGVIIKDTGWQIPSEFTKGGGYSKSYNLSAYGSGAYKWRVRAKNDHGTGGWREVKNQIAALAKPVITAPAGGTYPTDTVIQIRWPRVPGATEYEVVFTQGGSSFPMPLVPANDNAVFSYSYFVKGGPYACKVRALDVGYGPWSEPRTYTGN